ncbi:MAG: RraA family protein [Deltaproteobacteria bacterium]|nr:RraA family protein [Deltaproteobacteria bacterium]MBW2072477.1 RraA family protein [Deltaproteobacteria bacterium]
MLTTISLLLEAGTAPIADVFDKLAMTPPILDTNLFAVPESGIRFAGPAYTVSGELRSWERGGDRDKLAAIDGMYEGVVPVWAGNDISGVCCFGDLLAEAMKARGCAGVVVDGGIRDFAHLRNLQLPMMVRYRTPAQAIGRWKVSSYQMAIEVRGGLQEQVRVEPGDVVVADDDGVIVVPASIAEEIAQQAHEWAGKDSRAREEIRRGMPLLTALETFGHL